jgi:enterochelin esterase-like enzyme
MRIVYQLVAVCLLLIAATARSAADDRSMRLAWKDSILTISGPDLPGRQMKVLYIEAYCRPGATNRKWEQTVIGHRTRLVSQAQDGHALVLECTLNDGVTVRHEIRAGVNDVDFRLTATNPTDKPSEAQWAQPCVRVDAFSGGDKKTYLEKCFIFLDGKLSRMPTRNWATKAIYTPGQVWCPRDVNRADVNPRPLSDAVPDNGLIGCFSADEKMLMAIAFEPYQELFQGVAACIHSDFRIGGLAPGESKKIRGKIYILPADVPGLLRRYGEDFPEQARAADVSRPASSNVPGAQYPRIHDDLRVTFRIKAQDAQKVQVQPGGADNGLGKGPYDMKRSDDGFWTLTVPPAVPGFHYYWLLVDGVAVNDPSSETYFGWGKQTSGVEIPEKDVEFYDVRDVPHGHVLGRWYRSNITGAWRRAYVYLPPGYDQEPARRFPVLYLQHGAGEDERGWSTQGRMNFIMDNLLAANKARSMIVVMDRGYANVQSKNLFADVMLKELIPAIDNAFRTIPDREHRAMAGLSMGGMQTLQIGLANLDTFSSLGAFSAPIRDFDAKTSFNGAFNDPETFNKKVHLLWVGAGTAEERIHNSAKSLHEALDRAGIKSVLVESKGTAHEWQTWRRALHDFAPRLFQE